MSSDPGTACHCAGNPKRACLKNCSQRKQTKERAEPKQRWHNAREPTLEKGIAELLIICRLWGAQKGNRRRLNPSELIYVTSALSGDACISLHTSDTWIAFGVCDEVHSYIKYTWTMLICIIQWSVEYTSAVLASQRQTQIFRYLLLTRDASSSLIWVSGDQARHLSCGVHGLALAARAGRCFGKKTNRSGKN